MTLLQRYEVKLESATSSSFNSILIYAEKLLNRMKDIKGIPDLLLPGYLSVYINSFLQGAIIGQTC